ncbi:MAG: phospho-N-acetylmuramoyl-pentapeptide-transferase, partial [Bacteroidales bacterium]|nr:phospho-N-acetylmuramoyl-pentapeptide-transferase [Bacteroidales bacterium]
FKKNKAGLPGKLKIAGQVILSLVVGIVIYFSPQVVIKEKSHNTSKQVNTQQVFVFENEAKTTSPYSFSASEHSTKTTIPFVKNNEFDYAWLTQWMGDKDGKWAFLFFIPIIMIIIIGVSNGANLSDGIDGLATGTSAFIAMGIAILAYVSGNVIFADYLNIMYIPNLGELVIYVAALVGACIGFYWWNCYPAQIFMGDTGSLTLGGIIAVLCIIIRKEFLLPLLCGIFFIESLSVIIQTTYFKFTKRRTGVGKRVFRMAPLHHHYQLKGYHENKIVQRFIIVTIMLIVISIVTLKIR